MKRILLVLLVAGLLAGLGAGVVRWRHHTALQRDEELFHAATAALQSGQAAEAAALLSRHIPDGRATPEAVRDWRMLDVAVEAKLRDMPKLIALGQRWPEAIQTNEEASLLLARLYQQTHRPDLAVPLVKTWSNRSARPEAWFALQVDGLLQAGRRAEAATLLKSRHFEGKADCGRLCRLALLSSDDLKTAWDYLEQAYRLDSRNIDVRSFRGQLLERIGKLPLARLEYIAAHLAEPENPLLGDQLAEFYRRHGDYAAALRVWTQNPRGPTFDYIWVKSYFWSRVAQPAKLAAAPANELGSLVTYLQEIRPGSFWNGEKFTRVADSRAFSRQRQEIFWLSLLELLRTGQEKAAADLLRLNRFRDASWQPDLEVALLRILSYRAGGRLNPPDQSALALSRPAAELHPFFVALEAAAQAQAGQAPVPPELDRFLRSDVCFAGALLSAGWPEAALTLGEGRNVADAQLPPWLAYGWTQALRYNRGPAAALKFALQFPHPAPELEVVIAELQIGQKQPGPALERLRRLATLDSDAGFRAAWLLSLADLDRRQPEEAARVVAAQPRLAQSTTGREVLARVALEEHRDIDALTAYQALAEESAEAKSWLARRAFAQKDWAEARRYTDELMRIYPEEIQLRANLEAIDKAEHAL